MTADGQMRLRRPSTLRLLAKQITYQLKLLARSPMSAFATLVIPLMILLAMGLLHLGTRLSSRGGIPYIQFFTPAMIAFAVVNACYMGVIPPVTLARDQGILKRIRSTPLPAWVYMAGRIVAAGLVAIVGAVVVVAVGAGVYGFHMIWAGVPAAALTIVVAMFCFCSLALAVSVLVPSSESAVPVAWGTMLPLCFISDVFQPINGAPRWLRDVASLFPVRPFADSLESVFNPVSGSRAIQPAHLELMALWGVGAAVFVLLAFRWEPGGRTLLWRRRERSRQRSTAFAGERLRALLTATRGNGRAHPAKSHTPTGGSGKPPA